MSPHHTLALTALMLATLPLTAQDSARKDLFGDPLPEGATARMGTARLRNDTSIAGFAFSPDGKAIACGGTDGKVTTWDVESGKVAKKVQLSGASQITGLQYSKDGKVLAVGVTGSESGVRILDGTTLAQSKSLVDPMRKGFYRYSMLLSPDGNTVLTHDQNNQTLVVWDVASAEVKHRIPKIGDYRGTPMLFLPDNKHFVSQWTDRKLHLVSIADGKSVRDLESAESLSAQTRISGQITALVIAPDGKQLFTRRYNDRAFQVIDIGTGKLARTWDNINLGYYGYAPGKLAISHDGRFLVESSANVARVWGLASGKLLREFGSGSYSSTFALSGDGKRIAMQVGYQLAIADMNTGKALHGEAGHQTTPMHLAFTPNGKRLVSFGSTSLRIWDTATGKEEQKIRQYGYAVTHPRASDSAVRWIASDRSVQQFAFGEREPTRLTTPRLLTGSYSSAVTSPDGKFVAAIDTQSRKFSLFSLTDSKGDRELANLPQNFYSTPIVFSPDSRYVAMSNYNDRAVTLFDAVAGVEIRKLQTVQDTRFYGAPLVEFAPDGRSLLKYDGETRVIETASGGERYRLPRENLGAQPKLLWSQDGRLVARAYADGLVTVHDIINGKELLRKTTGQGAINAMAMSRDGRQLATGGSNTTILVWDVPAPAKISTSLNEKDAWRDLESPDATKGIAAIAFFVAQPDKAVELFKDRIKSKGAPDGKKIDQLIKDLDDDTFAVREKASEELADIGGLALEKIEAALKNPPSLEVKRRCEALLRKIKGGATVAPERLRAIRAVETLEKIGAPAAKEVLKHLKKQKLAPDVESAIDGALSRLGEGG